MRIKICEGKGKEDLRKGEYKSLKGKGRKIWEMRIEKYERKGKEDLRKKNWIKWKENNI